jgi:hypothetical protein
MKTKEFNDALRGPFYLAYNKAKDTIKDVTIRFNEQPPPKKETCGTASKPLKWLAWTPRSLNANVIYINEIFKKRALSGDMEHEEITTTIFFIGCLIIHELGHLLVRWSGFLNSPSLYGITNGGISEAGYFLEKNLFYSIVKLVIVKNEKDEWDETTLIKSICVRKNIKTQGAYEPKDIKLLASYINQVITDKDREILPLETGEVEVNRIEEMTLNANDSDEECEDGVDGKYETNLKEGECVLRAICGTQFMDAMDAL